MNFSGFVDVARYARERDARIRFIAGQRPWNTRPPGQPRCPCGARGKAYFNRYVTGKHAGVVPVWVIRCEAHETEEIKMNHFMELEAQLKELANREKKEMERRLDAAGLVRPDSSGLILPPYYDQENRRQQA